MVKDNESDPHNALIASKQQQLHFVSIAAEGSDESNTEYTQCVLVMEDESVSNTASTQYTQCVLVMEDESVSNTASTQYTQYTVQIKET